MFYETTSILLIDNDRLSGKRENIDKNANERKKNYMIQNLKLKLARNSDCIEIKKSVKHFLLKQKMFITKAIHINCVYSFKMK